MNSFRDKLHDIRSQINVLYTVLECTRDEVKSPEITKLIDTIFNKKETLEEDLLSLKNLATKLTTNNMGVSQ